MGAWCGPGGGLAGALRGVNLIATPQIISIGDLGMARRGTAQVDSAGGAACHNIPAVHGAIAKQGKACLNSISLTLSGVVPKFPKYIIWGIFLTFRR